MGKFKEHLERAYELIRSEVENYQTLTGSKLSEVKSLIGVDFNPQEIYYNKLNLILIEYADYAKLKHFSNRLLDILKLEVVDYNMFVYIVSYHNCPELMQILGTVAVEVAADDSDDDEEPNWDELK